MILKKLINEIGKKYIISQKTLFFLVFYIISTIGLSSSAGYLISSTAIGVAIGLLHVPIAFVRLSGLAKPIFKYYQNYFSHNDMFLWVTEIRLWFFQKMQNMPISWVSSHTQGKIFKQFISDVSHLEKFIISGIIPQITTLISLIIINTMLFFISFNLVLLNTSLFIIIIYLFPYLVEKITIKHYISSQKLMDTQSHITHELFSGFTELKFNPSLSRNMLNHYNTVQDQINLKDEKINNILSAMNIFSKVFLFLFLIYIIHSSFNVYKANYIYIILISITYLSYIELLENIHDSFFQISSVNESTKNIYNSFKVENNKDEKISLQSFHLKQEISFNHLNFQYKNTKKPIFKNASFKIIAKKQNILYAPSGHGKSTILKLLLKYHPISKNQILFDGIDINHIDTKELYHNISYISQHNFLFSSSIKDNLIISNLNTNDNDMYKVLSLLKLEYLLDSRNQLNTVLGEAGNKISGGEKQRIALARAYLKKAPLIILDEPTSSLDWKNKLYFEESLNKIKNKTIVRAEISLDGLNLENSHLIDLTKL